MTRFTTGLWLLLSVGLMSCSADPTTPDGGADIPTSPDSDIVTAADAGLVCPSGEVTPTRYLMVFNACPSGDCGPQDHTVHLAGSEDGKRWTLIGALGHDHGGSVPDIVIYRGQLLLFHTRGSNDHTWDKLDGCLNVVAQGDVEVVGGDTGDAGWVDPSAVVDGDDLVLFYLPGIPGSNPAACAPEEATCTRAIRSARSVAGTFPTFTLVPGDRVTATVSKPPNPLGSFSDPDILPLSDGRLLLNISSGENTLAYVSDTLDGSYAPPTEDGSLLWVSKQQGGVPTAIQIDTGDVWLYVHGHTASDGWVIRRAISDGTTALPATDFEVVLDRSIFGDGAPDVQGVLSPSIIRWR